MPTPGKWYVVLDVLDSGDINVATDGPEGYGAPFLLARVDVREDPDGPEPSREEALANARLMAAAKEMYAVLKIITRDGYFAVFEDVEKDIQSAIAKAEGK